MMSPRKHFLSIFISIFIAFLLAGSPVAASEKNKKAGGVAADKRVAHVLWRNPGAVERLDFAGGPGGRSGSPRPPFRFLEEDRDGHNPKVKVMDAAGRRWSVKWGDEVHAETFAARLVWAAGYDVPPSYFVARGQIQRVKVLTRAAQYVGAQGDFTNARFSLRDKTFKLLKKEDWDWSWKENPFVGTKELNGLKILMMLTSNWDNKDGRARDWGSNTGIREIAIGGRKTWIYMVTDWGATMGKWGGVMRREKWDCENYTEQTSHFIKGVRDGEVEWGFHGNHTEDTTQGIHLEDVKWLLQYVGRITDQQIRNGLQASGATPEEVECFARAVRQRITQMQSLGNSTSAAPAPKTSQLTPVTRPRL